MTRLVPCRVPLPRTSIPGSGVRWRERVGEGGRGDASVGVRGECVEGVRKSRAGKVDCFFEAPGVPHRVLPERADSGHLFQLSCEAKVTDGFQDVPLRRPAFLLCTVPA